MFKKFTIDTLFSFSPFPNVAESIQKELDEYKASEGEVKRLKSIMVSFCYHSLPFGIFHIHSFDAAIFGAMGQMLGSHAAALPASA